MSPIGFAGKKKRVNDKTEDAFELHMGGCVGEDKTKLGKIYGDILRKDVPNFLYDMSKAIENSNLEFYEYLAQNENEVNEIVNKYLV